VSPYHSIAGRADTPVVLTCEHASEALPAPWIWPRADRRLLGTHWSHDLGARELTRALAQRRRWPATLAAFTRLLVDPNRAPDQDGLFRTHADGVEVELNARIDPGGRARRMALHEGYHDACDAMVAAAPRASVLSIHSFTPLYEGTPRSMEVGVLFNRHEGPAVALADRLAARGWRVVLNAPWSGREGLMYAADRHSDRHGRVAIEIEVRQDVLSEAPRLRQLADDLAGWFEPG